MEELQDALEDAQYVNAIINVDEGPRPITAWDDPSDEVRTQWQKEMINKWENDTSPEKKTKPFELAWVLSTALGLFLFSTYVKDNCDDYLKINFIEEVLRWRSLRGRSKGVKLRKIYERYLRPCTNSSDGGSKGTKPTFPQKTLIDELDMAYQSNDPKLSQDALDALLKDSVDKSQSQCCIGIKGEVLQRAVKPIEEALQSIQHDASSAFSSAGGSQKFQQMPQFSSATESFLSGALEGKTTATAEEGQEEPKKIAPALSRSFVLSKLPNNLFDELEQVVIECLRRKYWSKFAVKGVHQWDKLLDFLWHESQPIVEEDFFLMRVLGRGGFGLVTGMVIIAHNNSFFFASRFYLTNVTTILFAACKKGTTGKLYAMKVMNKRRIKAKKSSMLALSELSVLKAVDSPFVVNLKYSFQTKDDLYLILDLMTGGDLSFHLSQKRRFNKDQCLYYAARIMLGLQALHDKNYVYRDLKPENLLLAEDGRVRITDLGLAIPVTPKLHGAAGTRGYWAPEMLKRNENGKRMNYDHRVDWFSYGCVLAEMISGLNPFRTEAALKYGLDKESTKVSLHVLL